MKILFFILVLASFSSIAARPIRGTYEVPVKNELRDFASYPIKFKSENYDRDFKKFTFPLPLELTGSENNITIYQNPSQPEIYTGENASGTCGKEGRYFICQLRFKNLNSDLNRLMEIISSQFPDSRNERLQVAQTFLFGDNETASFADHEPAGILKYRLRGGEEY